MPMQPRQSTYATAHEVTHDKHHGEGAVDRGVAPYPATGIPLPNLRCERQVLKLVAGFAVMGPLLAAYLGHF